MTRPSFLFHGSRSAEALSVLEPRGAPQLKNGKEGVYLFATPRYDQACLYTAPFPQNGGVMITLTPDQRSPLVMVAFEPADVYLSSSVDGLVYKVAADSFEPVLSRDRQSYAREWVSAQPVVPQRVIERITSFDQIMATGVQIVTMEDLKAPEIFLADGPLSMIERLAHVFKQGARWMNDEKKIRPNKTLGAWLTGAKAGPS